MEMRTSCPNNNKYYIRQVSGGWNGAIQGNPTKAGANVLANCVGYANGRFAEIIGKDKIEYQMTCNASGFVIRGPRDYKLTVMPYPTLGGIMCWEGGSGGAGHVAIVERIDSGNKIYTSESAYRGSAFYNATRTNDNGRWGMGIFYKFQGCIINPAIGDVHWEAPKSNTMYVNTVSAPLNVRENDNWGKVIGQLSKGTQVNVIDRSGNWSKIDSPINGWVSTQYLSDMQPVNRNTVGQTKTLKANVKLWSNPSLTGTSYSYLKGTKVKVLENVNDSVDKINVPATGRTAYINISWYR